MISTIKAFSVVGRLDKLTSGIVVLAKSADAHRALQRIWAEADKEYLAVVRGHVEAEGGRIDLPLGTDPADRRRRIVRADGAPSVTLFERLAYDPSTDRSVVRCRPVTGRRHQIRPIRSLGGTQRQQRRAKPVGNRAIKGIAKCSYPPRRCGK